MAVFAYALLVGSVLVVLGCMGHVWLRGLAHALSAREGTAAGRARQRLWVGAMLLFGPLGALTYWLVACPRSA
jgi:hypothetical protein